jgi:hypothetical protein
MTTIADFAPAFIRRAFFVSALLSAGAVLAAPPPTAAPPQLAQVGKPDAAESAAILERFRRSGWMGYVEFDLRALPRRGQEAVYHGRLWGGRNEQGAVTRIELADAKGGVHRVLLQNGEKPGVWRAGSGGVAQVAGAAVLEPLIPGVDVTAFDLQMPFLYWPGAVVESVERVRGRPAYLFVFRTPSAEAAHYPGIKSVRAYFDAQYSAPLQIELLGDRQTLKTISLGELKKVGDQWIPKSLDLRNDETRNKTRFEVTAVALNLKFDGPVFAPAGLLEPLSPPASNQLQRVEQ